MIRRALICVVAVAIALTGGSPAIAQQPEAPSVTKIENESELLDPAERAEHQRILVMLEQAPNRLRPGATYSSGYGGAQTKAARERLGRAIAKEYGLDFVELWPMPLIGLDCLIFAVSDQTTTEEAAKAVEQHPAVKWAEPMEFFATLAQPGQPDPLAALSPTTRFWNLTRVHSRWTGRNVRVAVIDTQVDAGHPDLSGRINVSRNFAPQAPARSEFHGTEVAGIIAATAGNGMGIAGVAPEAELMALRACWQQGQLRRSVCTSLNLARALNYAIERNANVINLSLGGPPSKLLTELIDTATRRGIAVVASYDPDRPSGGFPASHPDVIGVGRHGDLVGRGYVAPGKDIPTTRPGGGFHFVSGSSYSAAHVSGLLALRHERSRERPGAWRSLTLLDPVSREIDISANFE